VGRRIFLQAAGVPGVQVVEANESDRVGVLIEKARALGFQETGGTKVFAEDAETDLALDVTVAAAGLDDNASVHVGRCVRVSVTVRYAGKQDITRDFSPAQRKSSTSSTSPWGRRDSIFRRRTLLDLALQVCGQQGAANNDDHIGSLVTGVECNVCFDLVPTDRIQG